MKLAISIVCIFAGGCFYIGQDQPEDVAGRWCEEWSTRDCLTIIMGAARSNFDDVRNPDVKVLAIPCYPSVVAAITRRAHLLGPLQFEAFTYNHKTSTFHHDLDSLMASEAGVYVDWTAHRFVDGHGNYLRTPSQIDSLLFYVSLWCVGTRIGTHQPDITHLENNIYLLNDSGKILRPRYVWGKKNNVLAGEEILLVRFPIHQGMSNFIDDSENMYLVVDGFGDKIKMKFPISMMR